MSIGMPLWPQFHRNVQVSPSPAASDGEAGPRGAIVNVGSTTALNSLWARPAYVASKPGATGLTRSAADDYAEYGMREQTPTYMNKIK
jgi:NAD(P)-dependent dehydrogenase (short-subunit alcohol dehydrogenase family)